MRISDWSSDVCSSDLLVLVLILWCVFAYRRGRNQTPSRTAHHTVIEIIWKLVPVVILVLIAIHSIGLLQAQNKPAPDNALTLKAIGNQGFWISEYSDKTEARRVGAECVSTGRSRWS